VPSHAVELTAAYLDRHVTEVLRDQRITGATLRQKQTLATLMHLCGAGAAATYARRGFSLRPGERCGAHDARLYLGRVTAMQRVFAQLAG
jgi:hypothetical protein